MKWVFKKRIKWSVSWPEGCFCWFLLQKERDIRLVISEREREKVLQKELPVFSLTPVSLCSLSVSLFCSCLEFWDRSLESRYFRLSCLSDSLGLGRHPSRRILAFTLPWLRVYSRESLFIENLRILGKRGWTSAPDLGSVSREWLFVHPLLLQISISSFIPCLKGTSWSHVLWATSAHLPPSF